MSEAKPLWQESFRKQAQEVITERLAARKETGWTLNYDHTFRMRALQAWSNGKIESDAVIMKVLTRMKERGLATVEDFESVHAELRAEWARQSNQQKATWTFHVPLATKPSDDVSLPVTIPLLGYQFTSQRWSEVEKTLGRQNIDQAFTREFCQADKFPEVCVTFAAEGVSAHNAWNHAAPAYDFFRGLLEFVHGFLAWSHHWGRPKARVRFPLWPWLIAQSASKPLEIIQFLTDEPPPSIPQVLESKGLNGLTSYAAKFADQPPEKSTLALLADAFRLYSQALDERFRHSCLLGLWQMAETLTLSNRFNGDTKIVCSRLVAILDKRLRPVPVGLPEILSEIADKRNRIVHHGIHDTVDDEDINILKTVCEMSLWCVFHGVEKLSTQDHLNHFLGLYNRPRSDLKVMAEAMDWVHKLDHKLATAKWPEPPKDAGE